MGACLSICTGKAGEAKKATGFQTIDADQSHSEGAPLLDDPHRAHGPPRDSDDGGSGGGGMTGVGASSSALLDSSSSAAGTGSSSQLDTLDAERLKNLREEQARLDLLVATTGRDMVAVRSTRGSTGYYDQGFAAALAQHLEQTTEFPNQLPKRLPPPSSPLDAKNNNNNHATNKHVTHATTATSSTNNNDSANTTTSSSSSASALYAILSQPMWEGIVLGPSQEGLAGCGGENPSRYMDRVAESILDAAVPTKEELFAGLGPMVENLL